MRPAFVLGVLLALAGFARATAGEETAGQRAAKNPALVGYEDPLEPINRRMFAVDHFINDLLAGRGRTLAMAKWIPVPVREGLYNVFDNLEEPDTFANDLLQVKFHKAAKTGGRFAVNSTVGVFGVFDVASKMGLKRTREDFGQTLAIWGVTAGPYIFLPIAGPTTFRDAAAGPVDSLFLPRHWLALTLWEGGAIKVVQFGVQPETVGIRQVARGAAEAGDTDDEYATLRRLYWDQRADQIADRPNLADDPIAAFPERTKKAKEKEKEKETPQPAPASPSPPPP